MTKVLRTLYSSSFKLEEFNFTNNVHQFTPPTRLPPDSCLAISSSKRLAIISSPGPLSPKRANANPSASSSSRHRKSCPYRSDHPHPFDPLHQHTLSNLLRLDWAITSPPTPIRKAFLIWHPSRPTSPKPVRVNPRTYSPPPRVVTSRGFASTSTLVSTTPLRTLLMLSEGHP